MRTIARQLAIAVCPPEVQEHDLADAIADRFCLAVAAMPRDVRTALSAGLWLYDVGALVPFGRRSRNLDAGRGQRYFALWNRGSAPQRELAHAVKGLLALACYELPAMQESIGYHPGVWIKDVARRRLQVHGDAIRRHADSLGQLDPLPMVEHDRLGRRS